MTTARADTSGPPPGGWRVMIVEDNRNVAIMHRRIVDSLPTFRTVHVARNGEQALTAIPVAQPQLVILDLSMPGGDGMTFLRGLRQAAQPVDVIVVSASRGGATVRKTMHYGVAEYLVKPFSPRRLRQALLAFSRRAHTLDRKRDLSQDELDALQTTASSSRPAGLPKGLKPTTLRDIAETLMASDDSLTASDVAEQVGVARVTARRYLEHLHVMGILDVEQEPSGRGRPRNRYRHRQMTVP